MCDWPVHDRPCYWRGDYRFGTMEFCRKHFNVLVDGLLETMRSEACSMIEAGRVTPGGVERRARAVLTEINMERQPAKYELEGRPSRIYFAERGGYVKIGWTTDVPGRMKTLAAGGSGIAGMTVGPVTLLATMPGGRKEERELHRRFFRWRIALNREWFAYEGDVRKYVEGLQAAAGPLAET